MPEGVECVLERPSLLVDRYGREGSLMVELMVLDDGVVRTVVKREPTHVFYKEGGAGGVASLRGFP